MQHLQKTGRYPLDSYETCQWRGRHTFSLDKDLESLAHPFRVDQRLELQPCFRAFRLRLALIIEVRKFISLPEPKQKCRLRSEARRFKARSFSPQFERREIRVRRQILLARRRIKIFAGAMILIGKQRAAHVVLVKKFGRGMAVIDREHVTAFEAPRSEE